jgi:type VI secretion system protein ImpL
MLRLGAAGLAALIALVGAAALIQTRSVNSSAIAQENAAVSQYVAAVQALPLDPVNDADLAKVVPVLDMARNLPFGAQVPATQTQWFPGLSQTGKLGAGANQIYANALDNVFLPRLMWRLEGQMRSRITDAPFLYEAIRTYLMLGSAGPLDRAWIKAWMKLDWLSMFPGPMGQATRDSLAAHLDTLLDQPLPHVTLDGALVDDARRTFSRVTLAERVYQVIRNSPEAAALPQWVPADAAGASGLSVFTRRSGASLDSGLPGFYTVDGFYKVVLPMLPKALAQVADDSWVLGKQSEFSAASPQAQTLQQDVVKLYSDEYAANWDAFLADIDLPPLTNSQQSVQTLYILSSPHSPMRDMLTAIVKQLMLTQAPPVSPTAAGAAQVAAGAAGALANSATAKLQGLLGAPGTPVEPPGKAIEQRYDALIKFVGKGPGSPLDSVLKALSDLQQALDRLNNPTPGAAVVSGGAASAIEQLRTQAAQSPEPVRRWLIAMVGGGSSPGGSSPGGGMPGKSGAASPPPPGGGGAIQKQLALAQKQATLQAFNAPDGPATLCQRAVAGRYPFVPSSANDIPLDDFARLFAPGGLLDTFFNTQLRPFVNMAGTNWKLQPAGDVEPPISQGDLAQFQRAAAIRDLFFGPGGKDPAVRFDITPISADNVTKQVTIDLGDQQIVYAHGPTRPVTVNWPGTNRIISARLAFDPPPSSGSPVIQTSGPWALFRLFDHGTLRQTGSADRYNLDFVLGDRTASFEIRAGSVLNPLAPGLLRAFSCPGI